MSTIVTTVGDDVCFDPQFPGYLQKKTVHGSVRFIGEISGQKGVFYGVELNQLKTHNDQDHSHFQTNNQSIFIKKNQIIETFAESNANAPRITVGDIARVPKLKCNGLVRFVGELSTPYTILYGLHLQKKRGDNDGSIQGHRYFTCLAGYGCFVKADEIKLLKKNRKKKKKKKTKECETVALYSGMGVVSSKIKQKKESVAFYEEKYYVLLSKFFARYFRIECLEVPHVIADLITKFCDDSDHKNIFTDRDMYYALIWEHTY
eukprot:210255_1